MEQVAQPDVVRLDVPADHKYLNVLGACVGALLDRIEGLQDRESLAYNVELAIYETCANIVEHAYAEAPGRIVVDFAVQEAARQLVVDVRDSGKSFDLSQVQEPDFDEVQTRGYGLFLVRSLVDEVSYKPQSGENRWRLVKNF